jgi:hypothetical protein
MRRSIATAFSLLLLAPTAHAGGSDLTLSGMRPIKIASVELNPLAVLVGRFGGQAQVGLFGPVTFVGAASRVSFGDGQYYSDYDEVVYGAPAVKGWAYELGPRVFWRMATAANLPRVDLYLGGSWVREDLTESGFVSCGHALGDWCSPDGTSRDASRRGFAIDLGAQATTSYGFYILGGVGHEWLGGALTPRRSGSLFDVSILDYERWSKWVRVNLALGFGY